AFIDTSNFTLTCGSLVVNANVITDGTSATGSWQAGSLSGSYTATRQIIPNKMFGGADDNPNAPFGQDPVNLANGSYFYRHVDVQIAGRGGPLQFTRAYNSLDPTIGPLGPGWTHSFNVHLIFTAA